MAVETARNPWFGSREAEIHQLRTAAAKARRALDAAGGMMGTKEACARLDTSSGNLGKLAGLPEPYQDLERGKLWLGADIEAYAIEKGRGENGA